MKEEHSLPIVIVGHVDHGKSTLIGRLLYDTGSLPEGKIEEIRMASEATGREMEFSFLMDHLEEERERGITIDISQTFFSSDKRRYVIIDAPGHKEFLKNMITGSSQAEAALLLVDIAEGIRDQTRRHAFILSMLGLKQIAVIVNKIDMVEYSKDKFDLMVSEVRNLLKQFNIHPSYVIPISARNGSNVATKDERLNWFDGPTVLEALDSFNTLVIEDKPLRFPVQDVYDINGRNIVVGRIEAGKIRKGEVLSILPEGGQAKVLSIEKFMEEGIEEAYTGECVGIDLDKSIARGHVLVCNQAAERGGQAHSANTTQKIHANIFWMGTDTYHKGESVTFKCATQEVKGKIEHIFGRFDPATIEVVEKDASEIKAAEIAEVELLLEKDVVVDSFTEMPELGRFVIEIQGYPVAGGIIV
ncbi:MAG: GTP-binding protein [Nitrospira sp.]|nr:GTP-binding protein [Nitrospira sp.]